MLKDYLIVSKKILPEYYEKVVETRTLLESGRLRDVSEACRRTGISRSTYYKYREHIMSPAELSGGRNAVFSMMLSHRTGMLQSVLSCLSAAGANILTITQSLPINGEASVTVSMDISDISGDISELKGRLEGLEGAHYVRLLAIE